MIDFIMNNLTEILAVILSTQVLAQFIVNLTPTPTDDQLVGKVYAFIEKVAGIWTNTAKEYPGERAEIEAAEDEGA
jgi:hypothetical protein